VLIAGGDTGGLLGGFVPLATSTVSTPAAEIYEALSDAFAVVGPLLFSREASATAVVLPNQKILFAGGSHCHAQTYPAGGLCGASSFSGFQCDALQTAELYDESTQKFTLAGANSGNLMTTARSGGTATLITGSGTALDGKVLITGGSTGSTYLALSTPPPGCAPFGQVAQNTAEIYDPVADTFTATGSIPGCAAGTTPPACTTGLPAICSGTPTKITAATESSTTVTITSTVTGLIIGDKVAITGVVPAGYDGIFTVTGTGAGTFTYTAAASLTSPATVTNGYAVTETAQCGLVDSDAQLLNNGQVLVTGGDYIVFLGQASPQAFLFTPGTATFSQTAPMNVARELPGITILPSGNVLVAGGITSQAAACAAIPGDTAFITNYSAEVYNPTAATWTLTTGSSATPGAAGGMNSQRIATAELFTSGPDSGLVIMAGGVNSGTTNGTSPNFPTCETTSNIHQTTITKTDLFDEGTGLFTATGVLHQSRGGYGYGILNSGPNAGDLVVIGGECAVGTLSSAAIGSAAAGTVCGAAAKTDYYELFNPGTGTWTLGTNNPAWFTPVPITSATESGTTVTITSAANPLGLAVDGNVTIASVGGVAAYNGTWVVTAIPSSTTFQYTATATSLGTGTGGTALAVTAANSPQSALLP
jgi:hypothetical protein